MAETMALSKILHVRESEKKDAQKSYQQSIDFFEEIATRLYTLLRKKEKAEASYESYLQQTTPINKIREQAAFIEILNQRITQLQSDVQHARNEMETKHGNLTSAHVEVKKFEKIIEHRDKANEEQFKKDEKAMMDEASIQQYLNQQNG